MTFEKAAAVQEGLRLELEKVCPGLLKQFSIDQTMRIIDASVIPESYKYVAPAVRKRCADIIHFSNEAVLELYHRLLLVSYIIAAQSKPALFKLPEDIQTLYFKNFDGILSKITGNVKPGAHLFSDEKFSKNLSICRLQMIPLGAQKVYAGRMSRSFLFKHGLSQFFRGMRMILSETKGFSPIYRMHTDSRDRDLMREFNHEGWVQFYLRTAELLKINQEVIGLCGSSWFFDPVVPDISPELAYLRQLAVETGAYLFYIGSSEGAVKDATFMSNKRMNLVKEGKYKPVIYTMILPRKRLLDWAMSRRSL